jgi:hypothetical protein
MDASAAPPRAQRLDAIEVPGIVASPELLLASVEEDEFMEEYLWHVNQYLNEHVRFSDTKAGSVIVLSGAILSLLYSGGFYHSFARTPVAQWTLGAVASLLTFMALGGSVMLAAWSMRPRLVRNFSTGYVFWESILAHGSGPAFVQALNQRTRQELLDHLAAQIYNVSAVCSTKFRWVGRSMMLAMAGAVLAAAVMIVT